MGKTIFLIAVVGFIILIFYFLYRNEKKWKETTREIAFTLSSSPLSKELKNLSQDISCYRISLQVLVFQLNLLKYSKLWKIQ